MKEERFYWLNEASVKMLKDKYLVAGTEPVARVKEISDRAELLSGIEGFSDRLYDGLSRGWASLASPVWANYGLSRGLPISCFGQYIDDDTSEILTSLSESGMMSKSGGGTSAYFGDLRPRGSKISAGGSSNGSVSFMKIFETLTNTISQNGVRRGSMATYLPVEHGDIEEFLDLHSEGHFIQKLSFGVTISDAWMQSMIDGDSKKRQIWLKILKKRSEKGYPYLLFEDNVNNNKPQVYKDKDLRIHASNLCTEIMLPSNEYESFVCCLSSLNLNHYDEWKDTDWVETMSIFLDTVLTEFIDKAKDIPYLNKAVEFSRNHRAIGLGVLGLHSYLQSKMISFEGMEVKMELNKIFNNINNKSLEASKRLASMFGSPPLLSGYGERFTCRLAIAPTTSSSFILGQVSPSIEPLHSNYFIKDVSNGKTTYKNPYLAELLKSKGKDTADVWKSILVKGGSVQHLSFLNSKEKGVFKTFGEISQLEIIQNVSIMQKYIDQGISLNVLISKDASVKDRNLLLIEAWKLGLKSLYYQRGVNSAQEVSRNILDCSSCEG